MSKMNINITSRAYPEVKRAKIAGNMFKYTISGAKLTSKGEGLRVENINSCTGIVINAADRYNLGLHLAPEMQPLGALKRSLEASVYKLQERFGGLKAFIYGGLELDRFSEDTVASFDLYNTAANLFDKLCVPFAMICGKIKNAPLDNMYAVNSNITIWSDTFRNLLSSNNQEEIKKLLEERYQFVETTSEHVLNIIDNFTPRVQHLSCGRITNKP